MNRPPQPLSRDKGGVHAVLRNFRFCLIPADSGIGCRFQNQGCRSPVSGGFRCASGTVPQRLVNSDFHSDDFARWTRNVSRTGRCVLPRSSAGRGFCRADMDISSPASETITIALRLAPATETVNVSATRTLVPANVAGADVESLNAGQLEVMRPVAADDALHFLPGAVVSTAGQRGGLSSLFVRGGESTYNKVIVDDVPVNDPGGIFDFGVLPLTGADRLEFVRGAQSTLYGSDAMTSVVQVFTRTGSTPRSRTAFRRRRRKLRHRKWIRLARRRQRPLRLQPVWRPVQHHGPRSER